MRRRLLLNGFFSAFLRFFPHSLGDPRMNSANLARLVLLSAIWGGSFLFMRIATPVLGPAVLTFGRVALGGLFLWALALHGRRVWSLKGHWVHFLILGGLNSALPFVLYSQASQTLSTAHLSVLNATAPAWGYVIGLALRQEDWSARRGLGLLLGLLGVALLILPNGASGWRAEDLGGTLLCLGATCCYGIAANYAKRSAARESFLNAFGTLTGASIMVLPAMAIWPLAQTPTMASLLATLAIGVVCSGVAYLLFFRLVQDVGPTSALSVTYLIPVFGSLWGGVFLGEWPSTATLGGMGVILLGTALVTGVNPLAWLARRRIKGSGDPQCTDSPHRPPK